MKNLEEAYRALVNSLLNDDYGITEDAYEQLMSLGEDMGVNVQPIRAQTEATDGRFYFPEE